VLLLKPCQLIGNGTFGDFALNTQSCALFSASVKKGFFMCIFILGYFFFLWLCLLFRDNTLLSRKAAFSLMADIESSFITSNCLYKSLSCWLSCSSIIIRSFMPALVLVIHYEIQRRLGHAGWQRLWINENNV
jgi:hypothetical protein